MSAKTYLVRTFGCQMNEHDSERIAGLLEADGLREATSIDEADVVVLNTCCIRENADNKLYGTLGHLKSLKAARPDLEIVVGGCLAQKDRDLIQARAGARRRGVRHPQRPPRRRAARTRSRVDGPLTEIWEETVLDEARSLPLGAAGRAGPPTSAPG